VFVSRRQIFCKFCALAGSGLQAQTPPSPRTADHPRPIAEKDWYRRYADHQALLTNGRFDVVFIGDSLTDFWTYTGKAAWDAQIAPLKAMNGGIAADRTEHILWRIEHYDFHRAQPKLFVLLMGTNNLGMDPPDSPESVVRAILSAARFLLAHNSTSRVLILGIPPSGLEADSALRGRIQKTNALLSVEKLPPNVSFLPLYSTFVDDKDRWRDGFTLDGTHFSAAGYAKLADLLAPQLKELLGSK
jgi:lysophospholipase L1-like esterase